MKILSTKYDAFLIWKSSWIFSFYNFPSKLEKNNQLITFFPPFQFLLSYFPTVSLPSLFFIPGFQRQELKNIKKRKKIEKIGRMKKKGKNLKNKNKNHNNQPTTTKPNLFGKQLEVLDFSNENGSHQHLGFF